MNKVLSKVTTGFLRTFTQTLSWALQLGFAELETVSVNSVSIDKFLVPTEYLLLASNALLGAQEYVIPVSSVRPSANIAEVPSHIVISSPANAIGILSTLTCTFTLSLSQLFTVT